MKQLQQGFTLIELMIVVAIIGILAALAVPAYQDYTIRSKVSEAASLASAARTAVDVYFSENGTLPRAGIAQTSSLGLSPAGSYNAKYVSQVRISGTNAGVVEVTLKTLSELGSASGKTVIYAPTRQGGNLQWKVSSGSDVPAKYLPRT
jgi:type IV pilus assembly protein PilA